MSKSLNHDNQERAGIWLEVTNARLITENGDKDKDKDKEKVQVQLKGDRADREPVWWETVVPAAKESEVYRQFTEALDKKRLVLARLCPDGVDSLHVHHYRIQFSDAPR